MIGFAVMAKDVGEPTLIGALFMSIASKPDSW